MVRQRELKKRENIRFLYFTFVWTISCGIGIAALISAVKSGYALSMPHYFSWLFSKYFGKFILPSLAISFFTSPIGWRIYYTKSKKPKGQIRGNQKLGPLKTVNTDRFDNEAFVKGIVSGEIKPETIKRKRDSKGLLTIYTFPQFGCEVHAHFNDDPREVKREIIGRVHIYKYPQKEEKILGFLDNYQLSMLRHHSEDGKIR